MTAVSTFGQMHPVSISGPEWVSEKEKLEKGVPLLSVIRGLKVHDSDREKIKAIEEIFLYTYDKEEKYENEIDDALIALYRYITSEIIGMDKAFSAVAKLAIHYLRLTKAREIIAQIDSAAKREKLEETICELFNEVITGALKLSTELTINKNLGQRAEKLAELITTIQKQLFSAKDFTRESSIKCLYAVYDFRRALAPILKIVQKAPEFDGITELESNKKGFFESVDKLEELAKKLPDQRAKRDLSLKAAVLSNWAEQCCYAKISLYRTIQAELAIPSECAENVDRAIDVELRAIEHAADTIVERVAEEKAFEKEIARLRETPLWRLLEKVAPLMGDIYQFRKSCEDAKPKMKEITTILKQIIKPLFQKEEENGSNQ